jgi:hypothetical protein
MSPVLERDAKALQRALESDGAEVSVSLSRETVELMARLMEAEANGQQVIVTRRPRPSSAGLEFAWAYPREGVPQRVLRHL